MQKDPSLPGNVRFNEDASFVERIENALKMREGYCPCRIQRIPENICPCKEFRDQVADPAFEGYCHCRLYYKSLGA